MHEQGRTSRPLEVAYDAYEEELVSTKVNGITPRLRQNHESMIVCGDVGC